MKKYISNFEKKAHIFQFELYRAMMNLACVTNYFINRSGILFRLKLFKIAMYIDKMEMCK